MNQLLFYLLQVIAASGLLYGYYHFALRNKKFHRYNRFYLLMAAVISIVVPFLNIPVYFTSAEAESSVMLQTLQVISSPLTDEIDSVIITTTASSRFSITDFLYIVYLLACLVLMIRVALSINKIRILVKSHTIEPFDKIKFINTDEPGTPFSFFRWLFWNRKINMNSEKGEQIFRHELFHIQQRHSWDVMFLELLTVMFWINPFFHLIKKEIKAIHEFLADEFAVKENNNWQYAELLLMQVLNTNNQLVNPFFHNQIKRRIAMITSSTKSSYQYLRKMMVLPVAALIVLLFAFTYKSKNDSVKLQKALNYLNSDTTKPKENYENYLVVLNGIVQPKRGFKNIDTTLFKNPSTLELTIYNDSTGVKKYGSKGKDGVIEIFTKEVEEKAVTKEKKFSPDTLLWLQKKPSGQGKAVITTGYLIVSDTNPERKNIVLEERKRQDLEEIEIEDYLIKKDNPLIIIDGKPDLGLKKIETISPNSIERINVLKNKSATDKYGEKGKNGVIEIITKNLEVKEVRVDGEFILQEDNKVFSKVEKEASFPGGVEAWRQFLTTKLNASVPVDSGAKAGTYTVILQFITDNEGNVSDIRALTNHKFGMEQECIRVMQLSPKWNPALQNGHPVKAYRKQPFTFVIADEDPINEKKSIKEITITGFKKPSERELAQLSTVYPNPTDNNTTILFRSNHIEKGEVRVYDVMANLKSASKVNFVKGENKVIVNVASLSAGTYIINVVGVDSKMTKTFKLIKK